MTAEQLKTIEAELQKRGYKKWTTALTSSEDWAWFKTFGKKQDEDGKVTYGYQIAFRTRIATVAPSKGSEPQIKTDTIKVYISLPIRGRDINEARQQADLVAAKISRLGHKPVNPFNIYAGKNPTREDHLCADLQVLMGCDAIYMCEGWEKSQGCRIEHYVAMQFCIKILSEI